MSVQGTVALLCNEALNWNIKQRRCVLPGRRPIDPAAYGGTRRERRRRITHDVMRAIGELSGQRLDGDLAHAAAT